MSRALGSWVMIVVLAAVLGALWLRGSTVGEPGAQPQHASTGP